MQGLGAGAMPPPQAQPGGQPPTGDDDLPPGFERATPEEQKLYNYFIGLAATVLYDINLLPKTVQMLTQPDEPTQAVAEVAASVAMRAYTKAKDEGTDIPGDVILNAGWEIVQRTVEMAEEAGVGPFTPQMEEAAFYAAADKFSQNAQQMGIYDQEKAGQDVEAINEMKASGRIDAMLAQVAGGQQDEPPAAAPTQPPMEG